jgi:hypothetical protein
MDKNPKGFDDWAIENRLGRLSYGEYEPCNWEVHAVLLLCWQASRKQALEEARNECAKLYSSKPHTNMDHVAHAQALRQCISAIRSLEGNATSERCCEHDSDCAVHNAPALPVGPCDCSVRGNAKETT